LVWHPGPIQLPALDPHTERSLVIKPQKAAKPKLDVWCQCKAKNLCKRPTEPNLRVDLLKDNILAQQAVARIICWEGFNKQKTQTAVKPPEKL
jgi:hypothetical protein